MSTISPVTLEFYAEYVDAARTGQTHIFQFSRLIRAVDGTDAIPVIMLDSPSGLDWNPCRDVTNQTITAKMIVADIDVTDTNKCKFFWYRVLENGTRELITDGTGDNDWEYVSLNKNVLTGLPTPKTVILPLPPMILLQKSPLLSVGRYRH